MKTRVLIVDDELWARRRIATLLRSEAEIEIAGECRDGAAAVAAIQSLKPDVVFLDIQMPGMDGFEVLAAIDLEHMPVFIFATAHDQYALRAFDANAVDYLLKPFDEERFQRALKRAREEMEHKSNDRDNNIRKLIQSINDSKKYLQRLTVKSRGRVIFLKVSDLDWIEASGNYVTLHFGSETHLLRETMDQLEPKLNPSEFVRIHRSRIVNLDRVKDLQPWIRGEQALTLKDGTRLTVGRSFRDRLRPFLENAAE